MSQHPGHAAVLLLLLPAFEAVDKESAHQRSL
jgi:hypothetical protein